MYPTIEVDLTIFAGANNEWGASTSDQTINGRWD